MQNPDPEFPLFPGENLHATALLDRFHGHGQWKSFHASNAGFDRP